MTTRRPLARAVAAAVLLCVATVGSSFWADREANAADPILWGVGTAVIDGVIGTSEWGSLGATLSVPVTVGVGGVTAPGTLLVMNDRTHLYVALRVDIPAGVPADSFSSFVLEFDNDASGGPRAEGDDVIVLNPPGTLFDDYRTYLPPCPGGSLCGLLDTDNGGTNDGDGAVLLGPSQAVYELRKPLRSGDTGHDFTLNAGDMLGWMGSISVFNGGGFSTNFPANGWGLIRVVDPANPTPLPSPTPTPSPTPSPAPTPTPSPSPIQLMISVKAPEEGDRLRPGLTEKVKLEILVPAEIATGQQTITVCVTLSPNAFGCTTVPVRVAN